MRPFAATDTENNTLYYSLAGTDASKFDIGLNTGQIAVKAALDFEAKSSYSVTVNVSDRKDSDDNADTETDDTIAVSISVTDVNEPPVKLAAPSVAKNSTTPASKVDVSWAAPSASSMAGKPAVTDYDVRYRQDGRCRPGRTTPSPVQENVPTAISGLTAAKSYDMQVRAVNVEGNGPWSNSGSAITDAGGATRSVDENSAAGSAVGSPVTATLQPQRLHPLPRAEWNRRRELRHRLRHRSD